MIRKFFVFIIVWKIFTTCCFFAACPLVAEWYSGRADRLDAGGKPDGALASYKKAATLNPFNARYRAEEGRLYLKMGRLSPKKEAFEKARSLYARAVVLSPMNAKYRLGLGEAQALLLLNKRDIPKVELADCVDTFRTAVALDPNNYYVNAFSGYYILLFSKKLDDKDRNFAIYRLRHALELNPDYANQIFSYVANGLGDFKALEKITPKTAAWQERLRNFLRNIDQWKYKARS